MKRAASAMVAAMVVWVLTVAPGVAEQSLKDMLYNPGVLKPVDSTLKVKVGKPAPDFTLPAVAGGRVALSQYRGKKNVVVSFVPAAGMGCTRFGEPWDMGAEELMVEAFKECLEDGGIEKKEIEMAWLGTCFDSINVG